MCMVRQPAVCMPISVLCKRGSWSDEEVTADSQDGWQSHHLSPGSVNVWDAVTALCMWVCVGGGCFEKPRPLSCFFDKTWVSAADAA